MEQNSERLESPLAYDMEEAARLARVSKATLYRAAGDKELIIRKPRGVGRNGRSIILADDLNAWLKSRPVLMVVAA